jgi:glutathione S-transferase
VPVLEFKDGTCLAESTAICRYFEEIHPEPPLLGIDARDRALVEMWDRRMEFELMGNMTGAVRHCHPYWEGRIEQVTAYGDTFTIADITAICAFGIGRVAKIHIPEGMTHLTVWHERTSARPRVIATGPKTK